MIKSVFHDRGNNLQEKKNLSCFFFLIENFVFSFPLKR